MAGFFPPCWMATNHWFGRVTLGAWLGVHRGHGSQWRHLCCGPDAARLLSEGSRFTRSMAASGLDVQVALAGRAGVAPILGAAGTCHHPPWANHRLDGSQRGQGHSSILRRVLGAHDSPGELVEEIRKLRTSSATYMRSSHFLFGEAPLSLDSNTRIKAALHVYGGALEVVFFVTRSWHFFHLWRLTTIETIQQWAQWLWSSEKRTHPSLPWVIKWDPFWGGQTMQICGMFEGFPFNNVDGRDPAPPGMYKTRCK